MYNLAADTTSRRYVLLCHLYVSRLMDGVNKSLDERLHIGVGTYLGLPGIAPWHPTYVICIMLKESLWDTVGVRRSWTREI